MKSIKYRITNLAPILITNKTGDLNMVATKDYISGNNILGALATNYINTKLKNNNIKPNDDANFFNCFLSGQVVFTNAYKVEINKDSENVSFPIPFSIQRMKKDEKEIKDILLFETSEQIKSIGGFGYFTKEDNNQNLINKVEIKKSFSPHQEYNPVTRTTKEGMFFNYESISPGQTFVGFIIGEEKFIDTIVDNFENLTEIFIGKSRNTQYGRVKFKIEKKQNDFISEITNYSFNSKKNKISLTFLSDVIISNEYGFSTSDFNDLKNYFKVKISGFQSVEKSFFRTGTIENYVSVWNLRKPSETCFLAGSSFIIELNNVNENELMMLQSQGIGERKNEGFGRIVFGLQYVSKYNKKDKSEAIEVEKPEEVILDDTKKRATVILKNHLKMKVATQALDKVNINKDGITSSNITPSQIGRLESFINSSNTKEEFQGKLNLLRDTAKQKLNNFKFGNEKFLEHLNNFKIDDNIFNNEQLKKLSEDLGINLNNDENFKNELYKTYYLTLFPSIRKAIKREK